MVASYDAFLMPCTTCEILLLNIVMGTSARISSLCAIFLMGHLFKDWRTGVSLCMSSAIHERP